MSLEEVFEKLKLSSVGKLKAYTQPVAADQMAVAGDLLCSYVVEDGLIRQGVLTISRKDKSRFPDRPGIEEIEKAIGSVFGLHCVLFTREYPNRGHCLQYVFNVREEKA
jgi:hypothetical protein